MTTFDIKSALAMVDADHFGIAAGQAFDKAEAGKVLASAIVNQQAANATLADAKASAQGAGMTRLDAAAAVGAMKNAPDVDAGWDGIKEAVTAAIATALRGSNSLALNADTLKARLSDMKAAYRLANEHASGEDAWNAIKTRAAAIDPAPGALQRNTLTIARGWLNGTRVLLPAMSQEWAETMIQEAADRGAAKRKPATSSTAAAPAATTNPSTDDGLTPPPPADVFAVAREAIKALAATGADVSHMLHELDAMEGALHDPIVPVEPAPVEPAPVEPAPVETDKPSAGIMAVIKSRRTRAQSRGGK